MPVSLNGYVVRLQNLLTVAQPFDDIRNWLRNLYPKTFHMVCTCSRQEV